MVSISDVLAAVRCNAFILSRYLIFVFFNMIVLTFQYSVIVLFRNTKYYCFCDLFLFNVCSNYLGILGNKYDCLTLDNCYILFFFLLEEYSPKTFSVIRYYISLLLLNG